MCLFVFAWMAVLLLGVAAPSRATITFREDRLLAAQEVAAAMDIPAAHLEFATAGYSAIRGKGVVTGSLGHFVPPQGGSFAILSTGAVASADNLNLSGATSTILGRLNDPQGRDLIEIELSLRPPNGATCLAFDYAFYSEEYPERVGRGFNDLFTATLEGNVVLNTFASSAVDTAAFSGSTDTTYDGETDLLTAVARLDSVGTTKLVLALVDVGDSRYDSAVFLDRFRWLFDPACETGPPPGPRDSDGDALLDTWEIHGIDTDGDGAIDLDLPLLGADPLHKDIFLEIDFMAEPQNCRFGNCPPRGHHHRPEPAALARIIRAFANAPVGNPDGTQGIRLHIDAGSNSYLNFDSRERWGSRSNSDILPHDDHLGSFNGGTYDWTEFDQIKAVYFSAERLPVFHYAVFAHRLGSSDLSGESRSVPGSDFIVSLGDFAKMVGSVRQQAGTLMHELGHNLGLEDGGGDSTLNKPNYLSVMNPLFQMRGLRRNGHDGWFDYSFEKLASLNEGNLDENAGLAGSPALHSYGTRFFCPFGGQRVVSNVDGPSPIDWNCNGNRAENPVAADVNGSGSFEVLEGYDDWEGLVFNGGSIGRLTSGLLAKLKPGGSATSEVESGGIGAQEDALIPTDFDVLVTGISRVAQLAGTTQVYDFQVTNAGENTDSYALGATSDLGWANLTTVPATVALAPGQSASVSIAVTVPAGTPANTEDEVTLTATSVTNDLLLDAATTSPYVPENPPVAHAGADQRLECSSRNGTPVTLDGSASQAPSGGTLVYLWTGPFPEGGGRAEGVRPTVTLPLGTHTITLLVNDGIVDSYPDTVVVTVVDTTPPTISAVLSPTLLWPANHKMWPITARVAATDICSVPTVVLTALTSSEPDDAKGNGDGNTVGDIQGAALGTPDFLFSLRAERAGSGPGRIYTTLYTATDGSGNQASDRDQVQVPHSQKK